jgi:hypothetical protein
MMLTASFDGYMKSYANKKNQTFEVQKNMIFMVIIQNLGIK